MSWDYQDLLDLNKAEGQSKFQINRGNKFGRCRAIFSATGGLGVAAYKMVGLGGETVVIPKGSLVTRFVYRVLTSFESGTDAATIAISVVAANDCVTATALNSGTTWDVATTPVLGTPVTATASTWLITTADSNVTATVAVEALTQGKLVCWLEWFYFGDIPLT